MMIKDQGPSQRQLRVGEEVRHMLSQSLYAHDTGNPLLDGASITVSEVRMSPDLRHAVAFVMPLGGEKKDEILRELNKLKRLFSHKVAQKLTMKMSPRVNFRLDESFDEAGHIENILNHPRVRRDLDG